MQNLDEGKYAEVIKEGINLAREFGEFWAPIVGGTLKEAMGIYEDKLKYYRWKRQLRLIKRSQEVMKEYGISEITNPLPLKLAIPFMQGATLEEDDNLQDLWVNLLINAVSDTGMEMKRVYLDVLERISPLEAKILEKLYGNFSYYEMKHTQFATDNLPDSIYVPDKQKQCLTGSIGEDIEMALVNLSQNGCITPAKTLGGGELFESINMTLLGAKFYEACTLRTDIE